MTLALSTAYAGGSATQVTSVCQPSASGGLSAVSSMVDDERGAAEHLGERVLPDGAEGRRERELLVLAQVLVVEEQHRVLVQRVAQQTARSASSSGVVQVDAVDDRTDGAGDRA